MARLFPARKKETPIKTYCYYYKCMCPIATNLPHKLFLMLYIVIVYSIYMHYYLLHLIYNSLWKVARYLNRPIQWHTRPLGFRISTRAFLCSWIPDSILKKMLMGIPLPGFRIPLTNRFRIPLTNWILNLITVFLTVFRTFILLCGF